MTYEKGDLVKYSNPRSEHEALSRFIVIEDRDMRLYVGQIVDPKQFPFGLTECFPKDEYEVAE